MPRYPERGSREHKLGETVKLPLPESRGGEQDLKVILGSSCEGCALMGLGHGLCKEVKCAARSRSDGQDVIYQKQQEDQDDG